MVLGRVVHTVVILGEEMGVMAIVMVLLLLLMMMMTMMIKIIVFSVESKTGRQLVEAVTVGGL